MIIKLILFYLNEEKKIKNHLLKRSTTQKPPAFFDLKPKIPKIFYCFIQQKKKLFF